MNHTDKLALRQTLEALAIDYWYEVDFNWGQEAPAYYTEDAVFTTSQKSRTGRAAIADFYSARQARGARTSLHLVQNFRAVPTAADRADCNYLMSLFAADGEGVLPSKPAIMVADVRETLVRQADGRWLCALRTLRPLFRDDTPTTG
ncbi:nuclear transport factor 2 family protein [Variovorax boronicumulans]|uniref:nuclear transport factor 2 family protein n=1 Tax=Variovorax boronicumulans TaxID=436515 RepID=UPI001C575B5F